MEKRQKTEKSLDFKYFLKPVTYSAYEISFLSYFLFIIVLGLNVINTEVRFECCSRDPRRLSARPKRYFPFLKSQD